MLGLLGLYLANLAENNIEDIFDAYTKGNKYNFDGGMLGKAINKVSGGKLDVSKIAINFANSQSKKTLMATTTKFAVKGIGNFLFNPYVIAGKMAVGAVYDSQKEYIDEQFKKEVFDLPDESNKYLIDERFNAVNNNSVNNMERTNYTIKQLLNSNNIAGSLIDRAFSNM